MRSLKDPRIDPSEITVTNPKGLGYCQALLLIPHHLRGLLPLTLQL